MQLGKPSLKQATSYRGAEGGDITSGNALLYKIIWIILDYDLSKQDK
jgi:hypothetical protein